MLNLLTYLLIFLISTSSALIGQWENVYEESRVCLKINLPFLLLQGYRMYVLSSMPWLRNFDFSAVTKCEARTAETWKRLNNPNKKKKRIEAED